MTNQEQQAWWFILYQQQAWVKLDDLVAHGFKNLQHTISDYKKQLQSFGDLEQKTIDDIEAALLDKYGAYCFIGEVSHS